MNKDERIEEALEMIHPLAAAVVEQLGGFDEDTLSTLREVAEHGADSGWPGFVYYNETSAFTKMHRAAIAEGISEEAVEIGCGGACELVRSFLCLNGDAKENEVGRCLFGGGIDGDAGDVIDNALAWWALESVGRAVNEDYEGVFDFLDPDSDEYEYEEEAES